MQVRVLSLPLHQQGCAPGRAVRLQPARRGFDSFRPCLCPWPSSRGTTLPRWIGGCDSRRTLCLPCEEAGVHRPGCLPGKTGSIPVQGASVGPCRSHSGRPDGYGSVEQPGVLAALTSRRSLVQIQPGLLTSTPVAQRRRHLPDVEAFIAGSSPAGGTGGQTILPSPAPNDGPGDELPCERNSGCSG